MFSRRSKAGREAFFFLGIGLCLSVFFASCRPPVPALTPPPRFAEVQGLASLKLSRGGSAAKSKFTFALALPDRGRIEVVDPLGRAVLQFLVEGDEAYLCPSDEESLCPRRTNRGPEKTAGLSPRSRRNLRPDHRALGR